MIEMHREAKIIGGIAYLIMMVLIISCLWLILSTEHYKVARYEIESVEGHRIYFDGGSINVNSFYFPIDYDLEKLSKGDDILIHYLESAFGRTYIQIEVIK